MGQRETHPFVDVENPGFDFEDFYELLGVSESANEEDIKKAYRTLVKEYHPDRTDRADAQICFEQLTEAKNVLTNPKERKLYNDLGHKDYYQKKREEVDSFEENDGAEWQPADDSLKETNPEQTQTTKSEPTRSNTPDEPTRQTGNSFQSEPQSSDATTQNQVYNWVSSFRGDSSAAESLNTVLSVWKKSWQYRLSLLLLSGLVGVLQVTAAEITYIPQTPNAIAHFVNPGNIFVLSVSLGALIVGLTSYSAELRLPQGGFIDDADSLGESLFTREKARFYRRRGGVLLIVALFFTLLGAQANAGGNVHPWVFSRRMIFGNAGALTNPWVSPSVFNAPTLLPVLRIGGVILFLASFFAGSVFAIIGLSIDTWYDRYVRGFPIHQTLWEPLMVVGLLSFLWAAAFPTATIGWLHVGQTPTWVQNAFAITGGDVSFVTIGVVGLVLSFTIPRLYFVRTRFLLRFAEQR
ncbi:J domain-containing protein [Salinibaculum rarum]|uniref:J domain-containing protein n=1 Tax=Salinibaculum rarum TaxID=3058903 RepID=UPI0026600291|nr:DnaJ domain-containing protein [Salinibaculum sp. KK48]